jgi:uncharacterized protein YjbI with pentapeptide repeats
MKKISVTLAILLASSGLTFAQTTETTDKEYPVRAVQVSFIPPLSTNGIESGKYINRLSFNALGGVARGLDGAEFSGLFAVERSNVRGAQFAGITNVVGGSVKGLQYGGIANVVGQEVTGVQFAGHVNVVGKSIDGAQFAGIANVAGGALEGAQFAGIVNVATEVDGAQFSGIVNVSKGNVKGAQVGLINLAGHVDGVQVGFINFAKDGYRRVEIWASDVLYGNIAFKMGGNRKFYNIFTAGTALPTENNTRWGFGYGLGTNFFLGKKSQLSIEGISYHIQESNDTWDEFNQLNQFRTSFIFPLKNKFALTVTPTFNIQVSQFKTAEGTIGTEWVSYNVYNKLVNGKTRVMMWPGLNVGIQF